MKIFAFLFACYFMVLSMVPCNDRYEPHDAFAQTEISQLPTDLHHHLDFCSPFCICSCCGINFNVDFMMPQSVVIAEETAEISNKIIEREQPFLSDYYVKIWQPPKIG